MVDLAMETKITMSMTSVTRSFRPYERTTKTDVLLIACCHGEITQLFDQLKCSNILLRVGITKNHQLFQRMPYFNRFSFTIVHTGFVDYI